MKNILLSTEVSINKKKLILDKEYLIDSNREGYFVLDLDRQFENPDLDCLPAVYVECQDKYERYELFKFNIILGRREDIDD